jgi:hypothetical protein
MYPQGSKSEEIRGLGGIVTNTDTVDLRSAFALDRRGGRAIRSGIIFERDFGTIRRQASYPAGTVIDGFTFVDPTTNICHEILVVVDAHNNTRLYVDSSVDNTGTWLELTQRYSAILAGINVGGNPALINVGAVRPVGWITGEPDITLAGADVKNWLVFNRTKAASSFCVTSVVVDASADDLTLLHNVYTTGLNWALSDALYLFRPMSDIWDFAEATGGTHRQLISWNALEAQRKLTLYYGDNYYPPARRHPVQIKKEDERKRFYTNATTSLLTVPAGWYLEHGGGGLCPFYATHGSRASRVPQGYTYSDEIYDFSVDHPFMQISTAVANSGAGTYGVRTVAFMYITLTYGYQDSDPVYALFTESSDAYAFLDLSVSVLINWARMNKNITGYKVWIYEQRLSVSEAATFNDILSTIADDQFVLAKTVTFDAFVTALVPTLTLTTEFCISYVWVYTAFTTEPESRTTNMIGALNHELRKTRAFMRPRFGVRFGRQQGAITVVDQTDDIVRLSNYNGDGVHEDDNFPDVLENLQFEKQKHYLIGHGEMLGMGVLNDRLLVLRPTEGEILDIASGRQSTFETTVMARRSVLTVNSVGVFWGGRSGINFLPAGGGPMRMANPQWANFYDGTLAAANGTAFVSEAQRAAMFSGYDPFLGQPWFILQSADAPGTGTEYLCWRLDLESWQWTVRVLGNSVIPTFLMRRTDGYLTIGCTTGLLRYPGQSGKSLYLDDVYSNGVTGGNGIEAQIKVNIGSVFSLSRSSEIVGLGIKHKGIVSSGTHYFRVDVYANESATALQDPVNIAVGSESDYIPLERSGQIDSLQLKFSIVSAELNYITALKIEHIDVVYRPVERSGTL